MSNAIEEPRSIQPNDYRLALALLGGVVGVAGGLFVVALTLDLSLQQITGGELWTAVRGAGVANVLGSLPEVLAAILGLSLTVVAIVVQLASQRYPAKIVDIFMFDRINVAVFGFMAMSCVYVVLVGLLATDEPPLVAAAVGVGLAVLNFGLLLPYFGHVFAFLEPTNLITQIEARGRAMIAAATQRELGAPRLRVAQRETAACIERIADNCVAALSQSDRNLALHSVRALESFTVHYAGTKRELPAGWSDIDGVLFGTLAREFVDEIERKGTWFEAKALMECERVLRRALVEMSEVVSQIASSTRAMGTAAVAHGDADFMELTVRFFNTYVRHGLNARDVRAVYNVLYEYRRLARTIFARDPGLGHRVVQHLVYYGRCANDLDMPFVTVTCAHDVRVLCQQVLGDEAVAIEELLGLFLTLDQPSERKSEEVALIGVRKAQSILGAFFLQNGRADLAELIRRDMRHENLGRLTAIRDEVLAVEERTFWEITDRGHNFDYIGEDLRPHFIDFFRPLVARGQGAATAPTASAAR